MATAHMKAPPSAGRFHLEEWTVDPMRNRLVGSRGEKHVHPKAMEVLVLLADRAGEVVSRDAFLATVWNDTFVSDQVLANAIWELRRALDDDPRAPRFIATVPKRGYRLLPPVESGEAGAGRAATAPQAPPRAPVSDGGAGPAARDPAAGDSDRPPSARREAATVAEAKISGHAAAKEALADGKSASPRLAFVLAVVFVVGLLLAGVIVAVAFFDGNVLEPPPDGAGDESLVVAILPFENSTGEAGLEWLATAIPDVLAHELASSRHLYVLDTLRSAGAVEEEPRRAAARARRQGAQVLVSGRVTGGDGALHVYSRFDASGAPARHFEVSAADSGALFQALADQLRLALEVEAADADASAISATGTSSVDAYRHYIEGIALVRRQDHRGALAALHRAIELDPDFALAHGELAHVYDIQGEMALAGQAIERALALSTNRPQAERIGLSRLEARIHGDLGRERDYLRQMVALRPRDARWIATLAWFQYTHFRQCEEAVVRYRQAIELDPRPDLYAYLGEASMACGRPREALAALEEALERQPENAETWRFYGYLRMLAGDAEGAERAVERALELAPSRAGMAYTQALLLSERRRYAEALEALRRFRGLVTGVNLERDGWVAEADVYRLAGDRVAAARAAENALTLGPAPVAWWISGLLAVEAGRLGQAQEHLEALEGHFAQRQSRYGLEYLEHLRGEILSARGEPRRAVDAFAAALEVRPLEQARFRLALARAWLDAGDAEEAASVLYRLLEIQPNHLEARCLAAEAHEREGRSEAARLEQRACESLREKLDYAPRSAGDAERSSSPASSPSP